MYSEPQSRVAVRRQGTNTVAPAATQRVVVDPDTHGRHVYSQDGNTACYQYTYDSRNDPRFQASASSPQQSYVHSERVFVSNVSMGPQAGRPARMGGSNVVVEEATTPRPDRRAQYTPKAAAPQATVTPIVEEPDEDMNDQPRRSTRPRQPGAPLRQPVRAMPNGAMTMMMDPFLEMERMHRTMMQAMMAPSSAFGITPLNPAMGPAGAGVGRRGFIDDDFFPFGPGMFDPFADGSFGRSRMGMGYY